MITYDECKKEFIKLASNIGRSFHRYDIIRDFAEIGRITIMNNLTPFYSQKDEDRYLHLVKKYDKEDLNNLARMLALVNMAYQDRNGDFLGECLMEMEMGNKDIGQFFTTYSVTRVCAELSVTPTPDIIERGWMTVQEPAAGGGAMIIAANEIAKRHNVDMFAFCIELSHMTADLCYINLSSAGVAAQVVQGNSLSLEMGRCFPTPGLCTDKWIDRLEGFDIKELGFDNMDDFVLMMGEPTSRYGNTVDYNGVKYVKR